MTKNPKVAIVTPIFNGKEHTRKFLASLSKQTNKNFSTIIVDDGSTDGSGEMIKSEFPKVILLSGDGSLWWSGGTNKGVKYAIQNDFDYVLTINNDVEVSEDYLDSLLAAADKKPMSLIGSTVYYRDDPKRIWYFGATFGKNGEMQHYTDSPEPYEIRKSDWLTGMGVLVPIKAYEDAGLYDEKNFPQYFGDAEFSLRAKRAGYSLFVNSETKLYADVTSSWVSKQISKPRASFFKEVFFSIRSPYQFKTRFMFYKLYWPNGYRKALFRLYFVTLLGLYASYFISILKNIMGVKRFRDILNINRSGTTVISFEASILNRQKMTGVDYYTRNLIKSMQKNNPDKKFELMFLGFKKPSNSLRHKNTVLKSFRLMPGRVYSLMMKYSIAPPIDLLCRSKGDIYIFPNFERWPILRRKPTMVIIYDLSFIKASQFAVSSLTNRLSKSVPKSLKKSQRIIAISDNTRQEIIEEYGIPKDKISVVYPAVDHNHFKPMPKNEIEEVKKKYGIKGDYILSLSTIEPRKNLMGTMNAYSRLPKKLQEGYSLVLAGGKGWLDDEINSTMNKLKSSLKIDLIGYVDEEDLPALYSGASLFVYPSFYEGWGMPIQEAMACGTPVVTAKNSSLPESGGDGAIYVDASNVETIAEGMEKILNSPELSHNLVQKGIAHTSNFTWENSAGQLMEAIRKTLDVEK